MPALYYKLIIRSEKLQADVLYSLYFNQFSLYPFIWKFPRTKDSRNRRTPRKCSFSKKRNSRVVEHSWQRNWILFQTCLIKFFFVAVYLWLNFPRWRNLQLHDTSTWQFGKCIACICHETCQVRLCRTSALEMLKFDLEYAYPRQRDA